MQFERCVCICFRCRWHASLFESSRCGRLFLLDRWGLNPLDVKRTRKTWVGIDVEAHQQRRCWKRTRKDPRWIDEARRCECMMDGKCNMHLDGGLGSSADERGGRTHCCNHDDTLWWEQAKTKETSCARGGTRAFGRCRRYCLNVGCACIIASAEDGSTSCIDQERRRFLFALHTDAKSTCVCILPMPSFGRGRRRWKANQYVERG
mmetsp:Transcript_3254/g.20238  ORF Transcript_3254/g.20238 Transcript_3254/m.20238 type:complete len:206 (-) Transcript_3254:4279-4896(-)